MTDAEATKLVRRAVTDAIINAIAIIALALWIVTAFANWLAPYDDTDFNGQRSGLQILTDCRTGLQYLSTREGGLTPRLDATATQIRKDCK